MNRLIDNTTELKCGLFVVCVLLFFSISTVVSMAHAAELPSPYDPGDFINGDQPGDTNDQNYKDYIYSKLPTVPDEPSSKPGEDDQAPGGGGDQWADWFSWWDNFNSYLVKMLQMLDGMFDPAP